MPNKINIAIADDHVGFREGLISSFDRYNDLRVLFDVSNGVEVMEKLKSSTPDVILMDLAMDLMNGEEAFDLISKKYPEIKVIIYTGHFNDSFVLRFIKKHVPAILSKTAPIAKIIEAIRRVHLDESYIDETVSKIMMRSIVDSANEPDTTERIELDLSIQEVSVIKLMCLGLSTKQISEKLHRSERTIDFYRNSIWHKTKIKSKGIPELMVFAIKHKILNIM